MQVVEVYPSILKKGKERKGKQEKRWIFIVNIVGVFVFFDGELETFGK